MRKVDHWLLEVSLKIMELALGRIGEAEKRKRFHCKVIRGRGLMVDSKSKVERVISFTVPAAIS